jgi:hypothetical protein
MARRGGFRTQAPRTVTVVISGILWLIGTLDVLGVAHILPSPYAVWSLIAAGFLLLLGALVDGL